MTLSISQKIKDFKIQKEKLERDVEDFINDKDYTLEERWDVFGEAAAAGLNKTKDWYLDLPILEEKKIDWCDLYLERYSTYELYNLLEYADEHEWSEEDINRLQEEILACGYDSFVYDW